MQPGRGQRTAAGVLLILRARANNAPGEWALWKMKTGLELAWRVRVRGEEELNELAMRRTDRMPSLVEQRVMARGLPDELAVAKRHEIPAHHTVLYDLVYIEKGQARCCDCGVLVLNASPAYDFHRCFPCGRAAGDAYTEEMRRRRETERMAG